MASEPGGASRRHLRTLFNVGGTAGLTDGQLLERFATRRGEAAELAFAAIVERHGPMVLGACRGILRDDHEAQDAFQATFLVLVRKGRTLWVRDSLGPWLHRVACRAAGRARVEAGRRRVLERRAAEMVSRRPRGEVRGDLGSALHEEVDRLPDRYRVPVVLCLLEGRTYEEAARHLGCPVGTVKSRLARGRERLRGLLAHRGLAPSTGLLVAGLGAEAAPTAMPVALREFTIRAAMRVAAGGTATAGAVPTSVTELTDGVMKMMSLGKMKLIAAGVLAAVGLAIGVGALAQQAPKEPLPDAPRPGAGEQPPPKPFRVAEDDRRWVKTLANGATIEVVGISSYPSGPTSWWRPDGSPLAQPPCARIPKTIRADGDVVYRAVVVRLTGLPPDANHDWGIRQAKGSSRGSAMRDGEEVPGLYQKIIALPSDLAACTVDLDVAAGPWRTVQTSFGHSSSTGSRFGPSYIFGERIATQRGTALTVSHDIQDAAVRLVAVDRDGKEHRATSRSGGGVHRFQQLGAEFDLRPDEIQEFRLQTRPFERGEIQGVALKPVGAD